MEHSAINSRFRSYFINVCHKRDADISLERDKRLYGRLCVASASARREIEHRPQKNRHCGSAVVQYLENFLDMTTRPIILMRLFLVLMNLSDTPQNNIRRPDLLHKSRLMNVSD